MVDHFAHENDIGLAILLLAPHGFHRSVCGDQTGIKHTSTSEAGCTHQDYRQLNTITEGRLYLRRSGTGTNTKFIHLDKFLAELLQNAHSLSAIQSTYRLNANLRELLFASCIASDHHRAPACKWSAL